MGTTVNLQGASVPVRSLENIRPTAAKAGLHRTSESEPVGSSDGIGLGDVIRDAVKKHYGSVKAAAISLNVDPSLMQREFDAGKFERLNSADADAKAAIVDALYQVFGRLEDPKARFRRKCQELKALANEFDQLGEFIA